MSTSWCAAREPVEQHRRDTGAEDPAAVLDFAFRAARRRGIGLTVVDTTAPRHRALPPSI